MKRLIINLVERVNAHLFGATVRNLRRCLRSGDAMLHDADHTIKGLREELRYTREQSASLLRSYIGVKARLDEVLGQAEHSARVSHEETRARAEAFMRSQHVYARVSQKDYGIILTSATLVHKPFRKWVTRDGRKRLEWFDRLVVEYRTMPRDVTEYICHAFGFEWTRDIRIRYAHALQAGKRKPGQHIDIAIPYQLGKIPA